MYLDPPMLLISTSIADSTTVIAFLQLFFSFFFSSRVCNKTLEDHYGLIGHAHFI